jgi:hypothetical protein
MTPDGSGGLGPASHPEGPTSSSTRGACAPADCATLRTDVTIERDVVTSVAGYGSQLGTLIDAVVESASGKSGPAMQRLRALKSEIDSVKDKHGDDGVSRARSALAALAESDPAALEQVVAEFAAKPG